MSLSKVQKKLAAQSLKIKKERKKRKKSISRDILQGRDVLPS